MHERKALMAELSDGFVALPGGFGTLDEAFEILTWDQLGLIAKPVVFLDVGGFYTDLFAFLENAVDAGFLRGSHRLLAQRALDGRRGARPRVGAGGGARAQVDRP